MELRGRASFIALFVLACLLPHAASAEGRCLSYEPARVTLVGTLVARRLPGPPNYRSSARGDYPETVYFLVLEEPVCVTGDPASRTNSKGHAGIREVQLVLEENPARHYLGERMRAKGTLVGAHMRGHHTPVVLSVEELSAAEPDSKGPD